MSKIDIVYKENNENLYINDHYHNRHEIIFITEGIAKILIDNIMYEAKRNTIIFISCFENHKLRVSSVPYKRYYITIDPSVIDSFMPAFDLVSILTNRPKNFSHILTIDNDLSLKIKDIMHNMVKETNNKDDFYEISLEILLKNLFISLIRNHKDSFPKHNHSESWNLVHKIRIYIDNHYLEEISLEQLSKMFFVSQYHISHIFKEITGYTFKSYLLLKRLSKAKHLLYTTSLSVTNISQESGFNNVNNFIRTFKKYTGTTPSKYRKNISN